MKNSGKSQKKDTFKEKEWCRTQILEAVKDIKDEWILLQIYRMIMNITKEGS